MGFNLFDVDENLIQLKIYVIEKKNEYVSSEWCSFSFSSPLIGILIKRVMIRFFHLLT